MEPPPVTEPYLCTPPKNPRQSRNKKRASEKQLGRAPGPQLASIQASLISSLDEITRTHESTHTHRPTLRKKMFDRQQDTGLPRAAQLRKLGGCAAFEASTICTGRPKERA